MKAKLILMILISIPITSLGQITVRGGILGERREEEIVEVLEEAAQREERINEYIRQQERDAQKRAEQIERGLLNAIQRNANKPKATNTTTVQRSGGLTISTDNSSVRTTSTRTARANQRKLQRKQEHQEWQKQRREEIEEQRRRQEERRRREELRRRQEEERRRQETYNRVYATEYQRAGLNSKRLSDKADWRVGEGAEIMDRTHSAKSLMQTPVHRNFDAKTAHSTKKHGIRSLSHRRVAIKGLDSHAIPWQTMKADARPWDEWYTRKQESLRIIIPSKPAKPVIPIDSTGIWKHMKENLGVEQTNIIRAVIVHECNGVIPYIRYEAYDGCYYLYDSKTRKIITVNDNKVTVSQLTEKDDNLADFLENLKGTSASMDWETPLPTLSGKVELNFKELIEKNSNKEAVKSNLNIKGKGLEFSNKDAGIFIEEKDGDYSSKSTAKFSKDAVEISYEGKNEINLLDKGKGGNMSPAIIKGKMGIMTEIYKKNSEKTSRTYTINTEGRIAGFGLGHTLGMGIDTQSKAEGYAELNKSGGNIGAKVEAEATIAKASTDATVMVNTKNGICFIKTEAEGKIGYKATFKYQVGKNLEAVAGMSPGIVPLSFLVKGTGQCYYTNEYSSQP